MYAQAFMLDDNVVHTVQSAKRIFSLTLQKYCIFMARNPYKGDKQISKRIKVTVTTQQIPNLNSVLKYTVYMTMV